MLANYCVSGNCRGFGSASTTAASVLYKVALFSALGFGLLWAGRKMAGDR